MKYILPFFFFSLQVFARSEISIPAAVEISQRELLRLGDIATVRGGSEKLVAALEEVVLREDARELLLSQHLGSQEILSKVRAAMAASEVLRQHNPVFRIPSQVAVEFAKTPVSRQEVERKIRNVLSLRCPECEYKIMVQSTPVPSQKNWHLDFSNLSAKGGFLLPLRDGSQGQIKWISGTIQVSRLTPVATRLISQGERLLPQDIRMVMTDITYAKDSALRAEDVHGQIALRSLSVGSPVWPSDLRREPAAQRGQTVKALVGDDSFEISVQLQAEESGFVGDVIKLKNPDTKKILSGIVTDKGVVKLQ